jgi:DNA polymerase
LYRVLYELTQTGPTLLNDELDPRTRELHARAQQVRQDEHRMHAFVRFRRVTAFGAPQFVAWYEPAHLVLPLTAPFFSWRFAAPAAVLRSPSDAVRERMYDALVADLRSAAQQLSAHEIRRAE